MRVAGPERESLDGKTFDVIVIGGGIQGVAIARECARAGRRTLIVEQHDFASGTTSRSTRIIHGGLRYLEHGELGLVRESLRERERLLRESPHLVRPMTFLLALPRHGTLFRSALAVRAGLWLYRGLGAKGAVGNRYRCLNARIDCGEKLALFDYEDAQCEFPERLVAEWLTEACAAGAVARNYAEVLEIVRNGGVATAVKFRDHLSGDEETVFGKAIVNATGPWVDKVCGGLSAPRMITGVRGSHLVLPLFAGAPSAAVYTEAADGRPVFVLPWNGQVMVGSTEVRDDGDPGAAQPDEQEMAYLFAAFQHIFPKSGLTRSDVRGAFAGVRALPYSPAQRVAGSITRKHFLHDHAPDGARGLVSVIGGKLTTAASLARECARHIGIRVTEPPLPLVAAGPASGWESTLALWSHQAARMVRGLDPSFTSASARAIAEWHGRNAMSIVRCAAAQHELSATLCPHSSHVVAEAVYAVRTEHAVTLADILLRRLPVALGACWDEQCSRTAATRIGRAFGWSQARIERELEQFEMERDRFLRPAAARTSFPTQHVA